MMLQMVTSITITMITKMWCLKFVRLWVSCKSTVKPLSSIFILLISSQNYTYRLPNVSFSTSHDSYVGSKSCIWVMVFVFWLRMVSSAIFILLRGTWPFYLALIGSVHSYWTLFKVLLSYFLCLYFKNTYVLYLI